MNSFLYRKYLRKRNKAAHFYLGVLTLGGTIVLDALIYLNVFLWPYMIFPWIQVPPGITDLGMYWTFNPGIMWGLPPANPIMPDSNTANIYLLVLLFCYFTVWREGANLGRVMFGRLTHERGFMYLMRTTKMIARSKNKLEKRQEKAAAKAK